MMRKIGLLLIALIIALGCSGVAFASWNETLQAKGTVEVDDCWIEYTSAQSNDSGTTIDPGYDKHVASTEVMIKTSYKQVGGWTFSRKDTLVVTITNAYPCYQPTVTFWVKAFACYHSAHLISINIDSINATSGIPVSLYDGNLTLTISPPATIPPNQCASGTMTVHIEQPAVQNNTYVFTITMRYGFW